MKWCIGGLGHYKVRLLRKIALVLTNVPPREVFFSLRPSAIMHLLFVLTIFGEYFQFRVFPKEFQFRSYFSAFYLGFSEIVAKKTVVCWRNFKPFYVTILLLQLSNFGFASILQFSKRGSLLNLALKYIIFIFIHFDILIIYISLCIWFEFRNISRISSKCKEFLIITSKWEAVQDWPNFIWRRKFSWTWKLRFGWLSPCPPP